MIWLSFLFAFYFRLLNCRFFVCWNDLHCHQLFCLHEFEILITVYLDFFSLQYVKWHYFIYIVRECCSYFVYLFGVITISCGY